MNKIVLFILLTLLFDLNVFGQQEIRTYVANNARPVNSISISDTDYSDIRAFGEAVGNARIVMLGEQDHGDAPCFIAKARLVKYLHEKLGFNVLAFESDFYGVTGAYDEVLQQRISIDSAVNANVFAIWTSCSQFSDMFGYIKSSAQTSQPLYIAGIDNQIYSTYTARHLKETVVSLMRLASPGFHLDDEENIRYMNLLDTLRRYSARGYMSNEKDLGWLLQKTNELLNQLKSVQDVDAFNLMALQNVRSTCIHQQLFSRHKKYSDVFLSVTTRWR
jgi:erythromycin esterase